jgi:tRNA dimethylallyltransferase
LAVADTLQIPIVTGPTGSGKTSVTVDLAAEYPLEVVSADSRQIIKYLDIGTAKPNAEELAVVPCHLVNLVEPGERYSAFRFIEDCDLALDDVIGRGKCPIVVGGTGLYLRALTEGVVEIEEDRPDIRSRIETEMEELGAEKMHQRLAEIDPVEASRIHPHNRVRVIRALEICELTGKSKSELMAFGAYKKSKYAFSYYCFQPEREALYRRINRRVDLMMQQGLLAEVEALVERGLGPAMSRAKVIGYDELLDYLDGRCTIDEAVEAIKQNSRRYAKRQMTWFRHQTEAAFHSDRESLKAALKLDLDRLSGRLKA